MAAVQTTTALVEWVGEPYTRPGSPMRLYPAARLVSTGQVIGCYDHVVCPVAYSSSSSSSSSASFPCQVVDLFQDGQGGKWIRLAPIPLSAGPQAGTSSTSPECRQVELVPTAIFPKVSLDGGADAAAASAFAFPDSLRPVRVRYEFLSGESFVSALYSDFLPSSSSPTSPPPPPPRVPAQPEFFVKTCRSNSSIMPLIQEEMESFFRAHAMDCTTDCCPVPRCRQLRAFAALQHAFHCDDGGECADAAACAADKRVLARALACSESCTHGECQVYGKMLAYHQSLDSCAPGQCVFPGCRHTAVVQRRKRLGWEILLPSAATGRQWRVWAPASSSRVGKDFQAASLPPWTPKQQPKPRGGGGSSSSAASGVVVGGELVWRPVVRGDDQARLALQQHLKLCREYQTHESHFAPVRVGAKSWCWVRVVERTDTRGVVLALPHDFTKQSSRIRCRAEDFELVDTRKELVLARWWQDMYNNSAARTSSPRVPELPATGIELLLEQSPATLRIAALEAKERVRALYQQAPLLLQQEEEGGDERNAWRVRVFRARMRLHAKIISEQATIAAAAASKDQFLHLVRDYPWGLGVAATQVPPPALAACPMCKSTGTIVACSRFGACGKYACQACAAASSLSGDGGEAVQQPGDEGPVVRLCKACRSSIRVVPIPGWPPAAPPARPPPPPPKEETPARKPAATSSSSSAPPPSTATTTTATTTTAPPPLPPTTSLVEIFTRYKSGQMSAEQCMAVLEATFISNARKASVLLATPPHLNPDK